MQIPKDVEKVESTHCLYNIVTAKGTLNVMPIVPNGGLFFDAYEDHNTT